MARSPPTSVQFIVELVAKVGLVDFHPKPNTRRDWKAVFRQFIGYFQHFIIVFCISFHLLSSICRSIRNLPEFLQVLYEDCIYMIDLIFLQMAYHCYTDIKSVANFMETSLSNADKKVTEMYQKKAKIVLCVIALGVGGVLVATIFEKLLPPSEQDLDMLRFIYRTKHPERRLFVNVWIPFIEETESGYFEVIYALELVSFVLLHLTVITIGGLLPVSIAHIEGQYTILSTYVEKIGRIHRDVRGNTVYYTNIENNEYVTKQLTKPAVRLRLPSKKIQIQNHQRELHKELLYERLYFRQVVMFHQKLNTLQSKITRVYNTGMFLLCSVFSLAFCLCLYQLTLSSASLSFMTLNKFIAEFLTVSGVCLYICHCSDSLDDCHAKLRRAVINSAWYQCSNRTRKDVCFFLRHLQRPNHLKFGQGFVVLSKAFFVKVVKFSYNLVNFMRFGSK